MKAKAEPGTLRKTTSTLREKRKGPDDAGPFESVVR
jgi:hypothetical protein